MSFHRATLVAFAALFTAGMTPAAFACCEWGGPAPVAYAVSGCGGCGMAAPVAYAEPAPPVAYAVQAGGCGCGHSFYAAPAIEPTPIVPAPIYVVNQGPEYSGPGIMVPYRVWSPAAFAPEQYPYASGYGSYPYSGHRYMPGYGAYPYNGHHYMPGYGSYPYNAHHYAPGYGSYPYHAHPYAPGYSYRARFTYRHPHYYGPRPVGVRD